jgi:hypothetical protein
MGKQIFILITREKTPTIEHRLRSLIAKGIDAYVMCDEIQKPSKRFLTYPDSKMEELGWTHHMSQAKNRITAWDKATYFGYVSGADYVWLCEDDVFWNQSAVISAVVSTPSDSDLIAYPLASYESDPDWWHWSKAAMMTSDKSKWLATYNQLSRVSSRVLHQMAHLASTRKRLFFHEAMFATICKLHNYKISYLDDLKLPIYISIRWNRPFTEEQVDQAIKEHKHVILHPVKFL